MSVFLINCRIHVSGEALLQTSRVHRSIYLFLSQLSYRARHTYAESEINCNCAVSCMEYLLGAEIVKSSRD